MTTEAALKKARDELHRALASSQGRFKEQLVKQELHYIELAKAALEQDDVTTAYNMMLNAELLRKMREGS